ncbi:MAG: enoyl-CoA hydratase/isomerase family protein [Bacteriovoracaceae bacterium]|nr:enoyl-CoA hydratase/isomerase family protein [Bacteriovoracaceae bacterium]
MNFKCEIDSRGVATVTLNRPELHNAFNDELIKDLIKCFGDLEINKNVRLVVLTGEGKSFCAGADLNWMKAMKDYSHAENLKDSQNLAELFTVINQFSRPVIGKINGSALGGGAGLVACCDYVVAVESAVIAFTEVRLGLLPAVISPFVIAKIGESHARASFLSGAKIPVARAFVMGLVHQVSTSERLNQDIEVVVSDFLLAGPQATILCKELIKKVVSDKDVKKSRDYTCETISKVRSSTEGQEGMSALLEKRKASWY